MFPASDVVKPAGEQACTGQPTTRADLIRVGERQGERFGMVRQELWMRQRDMVLALVSELDGRAQVRARQPTHLRCCSALESSRHISTTIVGRVLVSPGG